MIKALHQRAIASVLFTPVSDWSPFRRDWRVRKN